MEKISSAKVRYSSHVRSAQFHSRTDLREATVMGQTEKGVSGGVASGRQHEFRGRSEGRGAGRKHGT